MWLLIVLVVLTVVPLVLFKIGDLRAQSSAESRTVVRPDGTIEEERPTLYSPGGRTGIDDRIRTIMRVCITIVGILGGGYIIISGNYSGGTETTAGGIIGMVFGYWLK